MSTLFVTVECEYSTYESVEIEVNVMDTVKFIIGQIGCENLKIGLDGQVLPLDVILSKTSLTNDDVLYRLPSLETISRMEITKRGYKCDEPSLFNAIVDGDVETMRLFEPLSMDNAIDEEGLTQLGCAVKHNQIECVEHLLRSNGHKCTKEIILALHTSNYEALMMLGRYVNAHNVKQPVSSKTFISHILTLGDSHKLLKILVECGMECVKTDIKYNGSNYMIDMIRKNKIEIVKLLCEEGTTISYCVMECIIRSENLDIFKYVCEMPEVDLERMLFVACKIGVISMVNCVCDMDGVDLNKMYHGGTALHVAICNGKVDVVKRLLRCETVDVNLIQYGDEIGVDGMVLKWNVLCKAVEVGNKEILRILCKVDKIERSYFNDAMVFACHLHKTDCALIICSSGRLDINELRYGNDGSETVLMRAVRANNLELVTAICKYDDLDVEVETTIGRSVIKCLCNAGIEIRELVESKL